VINPNHGMEVMLVRVPGDCDHRFRLIATRRSD
jgi:hypothetical protein